VRWENTVTIDAPVDVVWRLTTDVERLPSVTPTVTRVVRLDSGPLAIGSRVRIKQPGQFAAVWTVTRLDEGREFAWETRWLGLTIVGVHRLEAAGDGCRNTLVVEATGRGARVFGLLFGRLLRSAIATENAGFHAAARRQA
jgi:uncharacterized membrane protein